MSSAWRNVEISYDNDPDWSISSGWSIKDVVDPTFVQNEACWLGSWWLTLGAGTHRLLLRRSQDLAAAGTPTRLGSVYLDDGRHDVNGHFFDGGQGIRLFLASGTAPTAPGALQGIQIDARLDLADIYNAEGVTAGGERVLLSRFSTRCAALWEQARYAAIWEQRPGTEGQARHGLKSAAVPAGFRRAGFTGAPPGAGLGLRRGVLPSVAGQTWGARLLIGVH